MTTDGFDGADDFEREPGGSDDWFGDDGFELPIADGPSGALFEGDLGTLPLHARRALVLLLKRTHVYAFTHPREWGALLSHEGEIRTRLNDLFLELVVDERNEVAYKRQAGRELENRPFTTLLKERRYTAEEAALLIRLRQVHTDARVHGDSAAFIDRNDILIDLGYVRSGDKDQVKARDSIERAVERLLDDDFLLKVKDDDDRLRISPIIETLLSVERVQAFVDAAYNASEPDQPAGWPDVGVSAEQLNLDVGLEPNESS